MVKFPLVSDFRDLLTSGDLIYILFCIMFISFNRVLKCKHFKGYFVFCDLYFQRYSYFCFPYP